MSTTATLADAIELAVRVHHGQVDKFGQPYILHVFGVASRCRTAEEKTVAFLHDTVEDTDVTFDDLRQIGFSERVVEAVNGLTRREDETYEQFVERSAANALSRMVKLADLEDNMDIRRIPRPLETKDAERLERYRRAWHRLAEG
jgi:(p)ppGpp synthase/HD superfamily hydrolase